MNAAKTSDVTKALRDLVGFTMLFDVDDAGYVIDKKTGERITLPIDTRRSPIILYQEEIRDHEAQLLNPFAEGGLNQAPSAQWLHRALKAALLGRLKTIMEVVIKASLMEQGKGGKTDEPNRLPMPILALASRVVDEVDQKTLGELDQIFSNKTADEFLRTYYERRNLRCNVSSGLYDVEDESVDPKNRIPTFKSRHPNMRKKTWGVFEKLLLGILGIDDKDKLAQFSRSADSTTCPRLSSVLNAILAIYKPINELLCHINDGEDALDLSVLATHIANIPAYADNARFMVQPHKASEASAAAAGATPASSFVPVTMPNMAMVEPPAYADGWQPPPTPVPMAPAYPLPGGYGASNPLIPQAPSWASYQAPAQIYPPPTMPIMTAPVDPPFSGPYTTYNVGQPTMPGFSTVPGMPNGIYR